MSSASISANTSRMGSSTHHDLLFERFLCWPLGRPPRFRRRRRTPGTARTARTGQAGSAATMPEGRAA